MKMTNDVPFVRNSHASTKINKNIFVYGGFNNNNNPECIKSLKSLYKIDC